VLGGLFKSREIDAHARSLAGTLAPHLSAEAAAAKASRHNVKQLEEAIAGVESRALAFVRAQKLGVYGKARLCNSLRWALTEQGADTRLLGVAMDRIVARVSGRGA